jgi:hypothetical protein
LQVFLHCVLVLKVHRLRQLLPLCSRRGFCSHGAALGTPVLHSNRCATQPNSHSARVLYHCIFYVRTKHTKLLIVKLEVTNVSSYNQKCKEKKKKKKKHTTIPKNCYMLFLFFLSFKTSQVPFAS